MNNLKLVKPQIELKDEYLAFYQEWKESKEDMVPWVISEDPSDFQKMLAFLSNHELGLGIPEGWVPDSTFWLINDRNRVIGAVNIRHRLSEFLFNAAGNVGSEKTIIKNGGKPDTDFIEDDGNIIKRYWIKNN
ncbi:GNAT family N-acetyltransferase [Paenibacillus algorifonticola]|uniref:GNAT family N-acetyltransferase n=1 Tax=Paenibacillus algorifonticola TaxID=684063 RepID=UPI003D2A875E